MQEKDSGMAAVILLKWTTRKNGDAANGLAVAQGVCGILLKWDELGVTRAAQPALLGLQGMTRVRAEILVDFSHKSHDVTPHFHCLTSDSGVWAAAFSSRGNSMSAGRYNSHTHTHTHTQEKNCFIISIISIMT